MKDISRRLLFTIAIALSINIIFSAQAFGAARIYIDPAKIDAGKTGQTMMLLIKVTDVKDLYGYQCDLVFPPSLINVTKIESKRFLGSEADTFFVGGKIDNDKGRVSSIAESKKGQGGGVNGSGTLLAVTIQVKKISPGDIKLDGVKLVKSDVTTIAPLEVAGASFEKSEAPKTETIKQSESGQPSGSQGTSSISQDPSTQSSSQSTTGRSSPGISQGQTQGGSQSSSAADSGTDTAAGQNPGSQDQQQASGGSDLSNKDQSQDKSAGNNLEDTANNGKSNDKTEVSKQGAKKGFFARLWASFVSWLKGIFS